MREAEIGTSRQRVRRPPVPPRVYGIADVQALTAASVIDAIAAMVAAGVEWIQLRAKGLHDDDWLHLLRQSATLRERTPFILWVNDRPDLARLVAADGVHLGQSDLPPAAARAVVGPTMWIGRSCHDLQQVEAAEVNHDVDLVAFGPIFATGNKASADPVVGIECLRQARGKTGKPLVAIGGIDGDRLADVLQTGADGAAMIGALCQGSVEENCRRLLRRAHEAQ
jgi:thiamine-phosphate pyrophosphorylase